MRLLFVLTAASLGCAILSSPTVAFQISPCKSLSKPPRLQHPPLSGWVEDKNGEWEWEEDDPAFPQTAPSKSQELPAARIDGLEALKLNERSTATPTLPSGSFKPKQSLGQNFLRDGNTVLKIIRSFVSDASETLIENDTGIIRAVELGPGAGALTDTLVSTFADSDASFQCIEIDQRSVELLKDKHPDLTVLHLDVLQVDYPLMAQEQGGPLSIIGNLPYYITSQILFALADASHYNAVRSATVTMQYEVARRIVAETRTKDYGILSVVFQLYAECKLHFKIPPTVFYPRPKVDSALIGLHFIGPNRLRSRLGGVTPAQLRKVLTVTFQQRRKTLRNTVKKLLLQEICNGDKEMCKEILESNPLPLSAQTLDARQRGDSFAMTQELPLDWAKKRPEELSSGQFVELTRLIFCRNTEGDSGDKDGKITDDSEKSLGRKVWRKVKHGSD